MHLNKSNFKIYQQIFELQNCVKISSHTSAVVSKTALKSSYQNVVFVLLLPFTINV